MEMIEYPKIQTIWKREAERPCHIIPGEFSRPEFGSINRWHVTEKIDGMNVRVCWDGENVDFRGRTDRAEMPKGLMAHLQETFTVEKMKEKFPGPVILFGEGYGAKIQKGGNYSPDQKFVLFEVLVDEWRLEPDNIKDIAGCLGINNVPFLGIMSTEEAVAQVNTLKWSSKLAETPDAAPEGIVCRSIPTLFNRRGECVMWKLKIKDYRHLSQDR